MLTTSILVSALAAVALAEVPEGYRTVYITSLVNAKFVVAPTSPMAGSGIVVFVSSSRRDIGNSNADLSNFVARPSTTSPSSSGILKRETPASSWQTLRSA